VTDGRTDHEQVSKPESLIWAQKRFCVKRQNHWRIEQIERVSEMDRVETLKQLAARDGISHRQAIVQMGKIMCCLTVRSEVWG
jgi:hypothetical protein